MLVFVGAFGYFVFVKKLLPVLDQSPAKQIPTQTITTDTGEKLVIPADWNTFKHIRFTLKYPPDMIVGSNNMGFEPSEAPDISVFVSGGENPGLNIWEAHIPLLKNDSYFNPEHEDPELVKKWDIKTFSEKIWQLNNKESKESEIQNYSITNLEKTTVAGRDAYMFSVTGAYTDYSEAGLRENKTIYLFVADRDGNRYKIWYPSNDERSRIILQSLQFTR